MKRVMTFLWLILAAIVVAFGYVRLAPSDPVRWHVAPTVTADLDLTDGAKRIVENAPDGLERLDAVARQAPRVSVLDGTVGAGMVTYVARTRLMGFPDYVTAQQDGDTLKIHSRQRFGRSDMGVNAARIDRWLARAGLR
jgi:hypothetical protein